MYVLLLIVIYASGDSRSETVSHFKNAKACTDAQVEMAYGYKPDLDFTGARYWYQCEPLILQTNRRTGE